MTASWIEGLGRHTGRPMLMGTRGMVSAGNPLAAQTATRVMMDGGNVVDAAVAASAVLAVTRPHMTGIGGDLFCLIHIAKEGRVVAINASGPAPRAATTEFYRGKGIQQIPANGPLSIETPGCVAGWDLALKTYGTMTLSDLLKYAMDYAEHGVPVTRNLAGAIAEGQREFAKHQSWLSTFLPSGRPPRPGEYLKLPNLAASLRMIQEGGAEAFYRGPLAEALIAALEKEGAILAMEDLAACKAEVLDPVQVDYRGYTVFEQPPVSQGHLLLQELAIAEGYDLASTGPESAEAIHTMVECKKLAFADRLRYMGDPAWVRVPIKRLLSKEYASIRRKSIDPQHAIVTAAPGVMASAGADTTHHALIDAEGNAVTMIQSLFKSFGSGVVAGETGITMNNRLANFFLDPAHPNALAPGKRTVHTLNTYMVFKDGRPFLVAGTPGADDQVQTNFQVICNMVDFGMNLQEAIEAPRWSSTPGTLPGEITHTYELRLENRFPDQVVEGLRKKGHLVKLSDGWSFASVSAVLMDPETGVLYGGSDPRRDGYAAGW